MAQASSDKWQLRCTLWLAILFMAAILPSANKASAQEWVPQPPIEGPAPKWMTVISIYESAKFSSADEACRAQHAGFAPLAPYEAAEQVRFDIYDCHWAPRLPDGSISPGSYPTSVSLTCEHPYALVKPGRCVRPDAVQAEAPCEQCDKKSAKLASPIVIKGNPIDVRTGAKFDREIDYATADGLFVVSRSYRSQQFGPTIASGRSIAGFGPVWHGIIPGRLAVSNSPFTSTLNAVEYLADDGTIHQFEANEPDSGNAVDWTYRTLGKSALTLAMTSTPAMTRQAYFVSGAANPTGPGEMRLTFSNGDYILFRRSGTFEAGDGVRYMVPVEKGTPGGYKIFYDYNDASEYPYRVRDSLGRTMTLTWANANVFPAGQEQFFTGVPTYKVISQVGLPDGTTLVYSYNNGWASGTGQARKDRLIGMQRRSATGAVLWARSYLYENLANSYALTGKLNQNGQRLSTYGYGPSGQAVSTELAGGIERYQIEYLQGQFGPERTRRIVTGPLGRKETYEFQHLQFGYAANQPAMLWSIGGEATSTVPADSRTFDYVSPAEDGRGLLRGQSDARGNWTSYVVDPVKQRPTEIIEAKDNPLQRSTQTTWHPSFDLPTRIVKPGIQIDFTYSATGQLLTRTETDKTTQTVPYATAGQARTTTYVWGTNDRLASVNGPLAPDANGKDDITTYAYDAAGNMTSMTNGLGHITRFALYDANGRPGEMTDPNGIKTVFTYDALGRVLTSTLKHPTTATSDAVTAYEYDIEGRVIGVTLPSTDKLIMDYDLAGRMTSVRAASGERIDYSYDAMSNVTAQTVKRANGTAASTITRTFDSLGRMLTETLGPGRISRWAYDPEGNVTLLTTPRGNATTAAFDALNRLVSTVGPLTATKTMTLDPADNMTAFTDPVAVTTTFVHNGFGEVIREVSPDRGTTTRYYDAAGRVSAVIDGRGARVNYAYDVLGRVLSKTPVGQPASEIVTYSYDSGGLGSWQIGRLTKVVDTSGTTLFQYDHRGNLLTKRQAIGTTTAANLSFAYDLADRIVQITYPSGRIVGYVRDGKGRVTTVRTRASAAITSWTNLATGIAYEPFGSMTAATLGNGLSIAQSWGNDARLASKRLFRTSGGTNLSSLTYAYDNDDNITGITDAVNAGNSVTYVYDALGRLVRSTLAAGTYRRTDWALDLNGNRIREQRRVLPTDTVVAQTDTYSRTAGTNRIASVATPAGTRSITYDARGNTRAETRPGSVTATVLYDGYGRLTSYARTNEASQVHRYNGLDERVSTTSTLGTTSSVRRLVTDPSGRAIGEYGTSATDVKAEFIWLQPEVANDNQPLGGGDGAGGYMPLAVASPDGTGGTKLSWVHGSHLGVPLVITDASGNAITQGDWRAPGFPGQSRTHADLAYNLYRDYDPSTGRYIQADPIGLAGGSNPYLYAEGNPVRYVDPSGLAPVCNFSSQPMLVGGTAGQGHGHIPGVTDVWVEYNLQPGQCVSYWEPKRQNDCPTGPILGDVDAIDFNRDGRVKWPASKHGKKGFKGFLERSLDYTFGEAVAGSDTSAQPLFEIYGNFIVLRDGGRNGLSEFQQLGPGRHGK